MLIQSSEIRQVPDTQEVYLDREGFSTVIFDILERVEKGNDEEALKFHLSDIVDEDASQTRIFNVQESKLAKMEGTKCMSLLAMSPPGEKMRGRANEPEFVGILLSVLRLETVGTDIVVAVNVPHMPGEYAKEEIDPGSGRLGRLLEAGEKVREKVLETFEVRDWGLFVQD